MMSSRFAWPAAAMLLFALVPTVLNVYRKPEPVQAGMLADRIPVHLASFEEPESGSQDAKWTNMHFGTPDFLSRVYAGRNAPELALFAARSHDAKKLFHFPELALCYGRAETARTREEIQTHRGPIPVHGIEFATSTGIHRAKYVLLYGDEGVANPVRFMLGRLGALFLGRRETMTIIFVQAWSKRGPAKAVAAELDELLTAACNGFLR